MNQIFAQLFYEMEKHRDTVLVTLIDAAGSVPRKSGSQMLVGANGRLTGTIGGGAVERRSEACALIRANREKFCAWNLRVVEGRAPEALEELPAPEGVFVGGGGGALDAIVAAALQKNARARIVISAIALETVGRAMEVLQRNGLTPQAAQLSVSETKGAGGLHLLQANNPVFLIAGGGND